MKKNPSEFLEGIPLSEHHISFSRLFANAIRYYHWHQCLELLFIEAGYGVIIVDNQQYTLKPGRLFIFPPFKLHKVSVEQSQCECYRRTIIHLDNVALHHFLRDFPLRRAQLERLCHRDSPAAIYDLSDKNAALDPLFSCYGELFERKGYLMEHIACLMLQLLTLLPEKALSTELGEITLSVRIMQWIEEHYQEKFSLEVLAADLQLSKSYVSRRFRMETGGMIHEYLLTRRIRQASELLRAEGIDIEQVAHACGFSYDTYFIVCFKKMVGLTPLQYRKKHAGGGHETTV